MLLEAGIVILVAVMVGLGLMVLLRTRSSAQSEQSMATLRQELQAHLATQAQTFSTQLSQLTQSMTQQLGQVRQELQSGVAASGQLASNAQKEVAQQLQSATEAVRKISLQIGEVQQAGRDLSQTAQTLQMVLGGAKTRGSLGEAALERLLEDALPQAAYKMQFRFSTGNIVDAVVQSGDRMLSVDSKFPLEAFRRLAETGEEARKEFSTAVRKHADSIAEKYILPGEHTLDYALMFVPSEAVYYELLMTHDSKFGLLDEYCRSKRVFPVSPNTFYACLSAIALSLQGQKIEENARHLMDNMSGLKKQLDSFSDVFDRLGNHLRHAQQSYEDADSKLSKTRNSLEQMNQGALPEAPAKLLEQASKE